MGKILRIIGVIPRFTREWKELYKLRQAIERFFGSAKRSRLLNKQRCLSMNKVRMHAQLSLLSYSATMLGRLLGGDFKSHAPHADIGLVGHGWASIQSALGRQGYVGVPESRISRRAKCDFQDPVTRAVAVEKRS